MTTKLIFATGPNGEFGKADGLPWDVSGDLEHFKEYTRGCIMIMSGATFASLPGRLPGRPHVVLGRAETVAKNGAEPDYLITTKACLRTLCEFLQLSTGKDVCVIGGRQLLLEASEFCDAASITEIDEAYVGEADYFVDVEKIKDNLNTRIIYDYDFYIEDHCVKEWTS